MTAKTKPAKRARAVSGKKKSKIRSMTGFGKGVEKSSSGNITVEVKTLNHKGLSIVCNMFEDLFMAEEKMKKAFEKEISRGKIFVRVTRENAVGTQTKISVNEKTVKGYLSKIRGLQKTFGIKGEIGINDVISLPGVLENRSSAKTANVWPQVEKALKKALDKLVEYREREGDRLAKDFLARLQKISRRAKEISKYEKQSVARYRKKIVAYIKDLDANITPDKTKLEAEVASFAKNCDIAEELTRLQGHVEEYRQTISNVKTSAGRKMDFIAQEMQREANTIGSKSSDFNISKAVIEVKSEIEKIREQIRNVE